MSHMQTMYLLAYGRQKLPAHQTVGYFNGNAPYLYIRAGSDAMRLPAGQCIPADASHVEIINPFPRPVEVLVGVGYPINMGVESGIAAIQASTILSDFYVYKPAPTPATGKKFAVGIMLKRGTGEVSILEQASTLYSKVISFPGADADFMKFKPAGCMTETPFFRGYDGRVDDSVIAVSGYYDDAEVAAWMAAASYSGHVETRHNSFMQSSATYTVGANAAVFYVREPDYGAHSYIRLRHFGADLSEFD